MSLDMKYETCEDCGTELPQYHVGKWDCKCGRYTIMSMDYREYGHRRDDDEKAQYASNLRQNQRNYRGPLGLIGE